MKNSSYLLPIFNKNDEFRKLLKEVKEFKASLLDIWHFFSNGQSIRPMDCTQYIFVLNSIRKKIKNVDDLLSTHQASQFQIESGRYRLLMSLYKVDEQAKQVSVLISQLRATCFSPYTEKFVLISRISQDLDDLILESEKVELELEAISNKIFSRL